MKKNKIIFNVATGLLSVILMYSVFMYFFNHEAVATMFTSFGYPTYIIYPYAVLKVLGLIVLWIPNLKVVKEWAYAGFFFAFILAFFAHFMIGDGGQSAAGLAMVLLIVSYIFNKRLNK